MGRHHRSGVRGTAAAGPHQADPLWAAHRHAAVGGRQRRVPRRPAGGCTRGDRPLRTNGLGFRASLSLHSCLDLQALRACLASGDTSSEAFAAATDLFYRRHLCRRDPWPDFVAATFEPRLFNKRCYEGMWGPTEFISTGVLRDYNGSAELASIDVPTLLTCGELIIINY